MKLNLEILRVMDYIVLQNNSAPFRPAPVRKFLMLLSSQGWDKGNVSEGKENGFSDPAPAARNLHKVGCGFLIFKKWSSELPYVHLQC